MSGMGVTTADVNIQNKFRVLSLFIALKKIMKMN
jgi:hypothetical protein